uniref:Uncharacterized protein n=1 Tax=viral metagenome TaxID=1070528 RepID=A0A6M3JBJ8_9ZZZZ
MMELVSGLSGVESDTIKDTGAVQITGRLREYAVGDIAQVELWNVLGHASIFEVQKYSLSSGIITTAFSLGSGWENSYTANNEEFMLREDGMFMTHITADIFDQLHKLKFEGDTAVRDSSGDITMDNETEGVPFPIYFTGKDYGSG